MVMELYSVPMASNLKTETKRVITPLRIEDISGS